MNRSQFRLITLIADYNIGKSTKSYRFKVLIPTLSIVTKLLFVLDLVEYKCGAHESHNNVGEKIFFFLANLNYPDSKL